MMLHDTVRHQVIPVGNTLQEKSSFIIDYVYELHQFHWTMDGNTGTPDRISICLARQFSMSYRVEGFTDDQVFKILKKHIDCQRKLEDRKRNNRKKR